MLCCLNGASLDEIVRDYMLTYRNFYGVKPDAEAYAVIADSNIKASLSKAFGIAPDALKDADLAACAERYLLSIGMREEEIAALKANLEKDFGGLL